MAERSSIFDMIGPVMIGPSSSHTAGVVRIGRAAVRVLGAIPEWAEITFYNSFARTYEGHGSDRAILAGLLDFPTDDKRIKNAFEEAKAAHLAYQFRSIGNASTLHPNSIRLKLRKGERQVEVVGISKGGGVVEIEEVNGYPAGFTGSLFTLIIFAEDKKGSIAFISSLLAHDDCNIATMSVSRSGKNATACLVIEMDSSIRPLSLEYLRSLNWVREVIYMPQIDSNEAIPEHAIDEAERNKLAQDEILPPH
ncbi:L-serine ammonia-lyase, iron-sulfur-dependent subunit beta [Hugenholtzia roseola]|uniref:L-serine ammonia-lyase, iron-sulfur-dependent subunit beta n=1 Tax=Hugenholtzia roseola TaxID=1002 RepID=UPI0004119D4E|nr:L-serine ammonia-lyase, iron-sulfur-dependent subunit beta [Hugenholtzia roseola]